MRERLEDIPLLVERFADELKLDAKGRALLGPAFVARLRGHGWPGNVRELRNAVERALHFSDGSVDPLNGPLGAAQSAQQGGAAPSITRRGPQQPVSMVQGSESEADFGTAPETQLTPEMAAVQRALQPAQPALAPDASAALAAAAKPGATIIADYDLPFKTAKEKVLEQIKHA